MTIAANLGDALETSTIKRRKLIGLSLGIGLGAFGLGTLFVALGVTLYAAAGLATGGTMGLSLLA